MAYISAEDVKKIRDQIKAAYPQYKWSITREHSMAVTVALMESDIQFKSDYDQVNHYWYKEHDYPVKAKLVFQHVLEIIDVIKHNYDRNFGNPYADYGDSNYFIHLHVGKWDKKHKYVSYGTKVNRKELEVIQI
jgi:hypothetical protein